MGNFSLPLRIFELANEMSLDLILNTPNDSHVGLIIEFDLDYRDSIDTSHRDFLLAPTKKKIDYDILPDYQLSLLKKHWVKRSSVKKLVQTLNRTLNYTLHHITLKFYVSLELKVGYDHGILKFTRKNWIKAYTSLNTGMRSKSLKNFQEYFYKLTNNSCLGKTLESKRNRVNAKLPEIQEGVLENSEYCLVESVKILNENLVAVTCCKGHIFWDTPVVVISCILDGSKYHMF